MSEDEKKLFGLSVGPTFHGFMDYGLSMWVCSMCDCCVVFVREKQKPVGWRQDRCPECISKEEG